MPRPEPPSRRARTRPLRRQGTPRAAATREAAEQPHYRSRTERSYELPRSVVDELRAAVGGPEDDGSSQRATSRASTRSFGYLERRLTAAAEAYERDRYEDALTAIRPVVERAPLAPAVKELYGLTLYRLGRWRQASKALRELHELTGSFDQLPVIADCERALGHFDRVRELWDDLRRAGVDYDVLVEGRLVMAGALADSGALDEAIALLEPEARNRKNPSLSHLRQWYALADLYERGGDLPRARQLFARIAQADPGALDAPERLRALR